MTKEYVCMDCFCIFESTKSSLTCQECKDGAKGELKLVDTIFINPVKTIDGVVSTKILKSRNLDFSELELRALYHQPLGKDGFYSAD